MEIDDMKMHLRNLVTGKDGILTKHFPMTTKAIVEYLIKELEQKGEEIDSDIKELFSFEVPSTTKGGE